MESTVLIYPEPISVERISILINSKNINPKVAELDLEMIKMKLRETEEGEGWTDEQCDSAEIEYKRYLHLCLVFGKGIVPNKIMDKFWHYHILDTIAYHKDCDNVFGHYVHHFPYFGMRGEQDKIDLDNSFLKTKELYLQTFGEPISREEQTDCWHDCSNRCWNECSSK